MMNDVLAMLGNKANGDPRTIAMNLLNTKMGNSPIKNNLMSMINSNDSAGIEELARNLCNSKGIDPDQMANQVRSRLGK